MKKKSTAPVFKRGDEVTWTSQASGHVKKKRGRVHEVVAEYRQPARSPANVLRDIARGARSEYATRDHRSYIVKTADGTLYWPLVKYLKTVVGKRGNV